MPRPGIPLNFHQEIVEKYKFGESSLKLAKVYKCDPTTIQELLKKYGVKVRNHKEMGKRYTVNESKFKTLNPESEYWAGFLFADGGVYPNYYTPSLVFTIGTKDIKSLELFKAFMEATNPIKTTLCTRGFMKESGGTSLSSIRIYNEEIVKDLGSLGLYGDRVPVPALAQSRHFWRGYVDGDGCISMRKDMLYHNLCGTPATLELYKQFIISNGIDTTTKIKAGKGISYISFSSRKAANIIALLYANPCEALERKLNLAIRVTEYYGIDIRT